MKALKDPTPELVNLLYPEFRRSFPVDKALMIITELADEFDTNFAKLYKALYDKYVREG